jgi:hypothetical protein
MEAIVLAYGAGSASSIPALALEVSGHGYE